MSVGKKPYLNLQNTLKYFKGQVYDGVNYAIDNLPRFSTPEEIYDWFKLRTTYINDPKGVELFQCLPTLLDANFHNVTGGGDCDCFTCATLTATIASMLKGAKFKNFGIVLVGRNPYNPVHIYQYLDYNGERFYIDLTNPVFNYEREYPYKQEVRFYFN